MGQDATETLSEIEAARQRIEHTLDVLEQRLTRPEMRQQAVVAGGLIVTLLTVVAVVGAVLSRWRRSRAEERERRKLARTLVEALEDADLVVARSTAHSASGRPSRGS